MLVVASTFPASDSDPVPAFVRDQVRAMRRAEPDLEFHVLAPHDRRSQTVARTQHADYAEYRFHYMWPRRWEVLAGRGIMPALRARPALYGVLPFFFIAEFFALARLARRLRPETIYAHWFTPQGIVAAWVARMTAARFVFTTHASDVVVWQRVPLLGPAVVRFHARAAHRMTAVSRRSLARLKSFFSPAAWAALEPRTAIIPMGVDIPAAAATTPVAAERTIVFVGRLAEKKGVHVLLEAVASARAELAGWGLVVAGDGPWRERLESLASSLGLDVEFPGYVTGDAKRSLIETASVYVVPSIIAKDGDAEGLPVSLLEGLAAGRICVATNESGADDIITDAADGFLVPHKDVAALSQALVHATRLEAGQASAMSRAARECASAFSWPRIARRHIDFLFGGDTR